MKLPIILRSIITVFVTTKFFAMLLTVLISSEGLSQFFTSRYCTYVFIFVLIETFFIGIAFVLKRLKYLILFNVLYFLIFMLVYYLLNSYLLVTAWADFSEGLSEFFTSRYYIGVLIFTLIVTFLIGIALVLKKLKYLVLFTVFSFLYVPMIMLVVYSFNSSRLVTVWAGFSVKWYFELVNNEALLKAVGLSLLIAAASATLSTVFGTLASYAVIRFQRFRGSNLFSFMTTAPLVMPDVITGLALLLLFVAMGQTFGWPKDRGAITIWMAHVTFCTAYVTVVVSARLRELDKSIEEAALDLGANPLKVFFIITLPMIAPALVSGWLLAFTLSLDDLVIASFVAGPGATTLPMLIFSKVRLGVDPQINALATIILLIVGIIGFISWILMRKAERRRIREMRMH